MTTKTTSEQKLKQALGWATAALAVVLFGGMAVYVHQTDQIDQAASGAVARPRGREDVRTAGLKAAAEQMGSCLAGARRQALADLKYNYRLVPLELFDATVGQEMEVCKARYEADKLAVDLDAAGWEEYQRRREETR